MQSHLMSSSARLGITKCAMRPGSHVAPCSEYSGHAAAGISGNWLRETFNVAPVTESVKFQTLRIGSMSTQPSNARHAAHVLEKPADRCCPHTKGGRNSRLHLSNLIYTPSGNSSRHISVTGCASPLSEMRLLSRGEDHAHGYVKQDHGWQSARVGNTGHGEHALVLAMVGARKRPNTQLVGARKRPNTQ